MGEGRSARERERRGAHLVEKGAARLRRDLGGRVHIAQQHDRAAVGLALGRQRRRVVRHVDEGADADAARAGRRRRRRRRGRARGARRVGVARVVEREAELLAKLGARDAQRRAARGDGHAVELLDRREHRAGLDEREQRVALRPAVRVAVELRLAQPAVRLEEAVELRDRRARRQVRHVHRRVLELARRERAAAAARAARADAEPRGRLRARAAAAAADRAAAPGRAAEQRVLRLVAAALQPARVEPLQVLEVLVQRRADARALALLDHALRGQRRELQRELRRRGADAARRRRSERGRRAKPGLRAGLRPREHHGDARRERRRVRGLADAHSLSVRRRLVEF